MTTYKSEQTKQQGGKLGQTVISRFVAAVKSQSNVFLFSLVTGALLLGTVVGNSQITNKVLVDPTKPWLGYMNFYSYTGNGAPGTYLGGSVYTNIADLRAYFEGADTNLVLQTCTNVWYNTNFVTTGGTPIRWMDANMYHEEASILSGSTVVFSGICVTNQLQTVYPYSGYIVAFIKEFAPGYNYIGMTTTNLLQGKRFAVTRNIGVGNICQYGVEMGGPPSHPTNSVSSKKVVLAQETPDPSVTSLKSQSLVEGQNFTFTVTGRGTAPLKYEWLFESQTETNILVNGGRISGATTNSLTISNVTAADAGLYTVTVSNSLGTASARANIVVVPLTQAATNMLVDPGFEVGYLPNDPAAGWFAFSGAGLSTLGDYYFLSSTPVDIQSGTNCLQIYSAGPGTYTGAYQDRPASPGAVYTADGWFLTPYEDQITGSNVCYLEVQFQNAAGGVLLDYQTDKITSTTPTNTWINLVPNNIVSNDFATSLGTAPGYMVAPAGTAKVRYQLTYQSVDGQGSVYVDSFSLRLREPVISASVSGGNVHLSVPTLYGPNYRVLYKTNINDPVWQVLTSFTGDGTVKTILDPIGLTHRFYIVNTQ